MSPTQLQVVTDLQKLLSVQGGSLQEPLPVEPFKISNCHSTQRPKQ